MPDTPHPPPTVPAPEPKRRVRAGTGEPQFTDAETEFMLAVLAWKKRTGRQFPTCSDYLQIARECGYAKAPAEPAQPEESRL